jgi:hypothetical protein
MGASLRAIHVHVWVVVCAVLGVGALAPASADAHGAINPVASSYLARIASVPPGLSARVVDGDLRLWLQVPRHESVVVLDYRGAPYLRFDDGRIWANRNSQMYYYNQIPPANPPSRLGKMTPPHWIAVGDGYTYEWHDSRLQALALEAIAPGSSDLGAWRIPLVLDGHQLAVSGTLRFRPAPSIAWFWPVVVLLLCVLAAWRLHDLQIDAAVARFVALFTLVGITLAAIGRDLHGRPGLSGFGVAELTFIAVLAAWTAWRTVRGRARAFAYCLIVVAALWEGITLIPTLLHGYVLLALPPFLGRLATVMCLGGAAALTLPTIRLYRAALAEEEVEPADGAGAMEPTAAPCSGMLTPDGPRIP